MTGLWLDDVLDEYGDEKKPPRLPEWLLYRSVLHKDHIKRTNLILDQPGG